jgi:hypothetical protein
MKSLFDILGIQPLNENKKENEHKPVFKETDPQAPFPNDTMAALKREINTGAKDLETDWKNALELVDHSFKELRVPKPELTQKSRWDQYNTLISDAVKQLYDARGNEGSWRTTNK